MKSKVKVLASIIAMSVLTTFAATAQRNGDYAYQNSRDYNNNSGNYSSRNYDYRNQNTSNYDCKRELRYQNRGNFVISAELQRLYQIEDALMRRLDANITLGDRREIRRDRDKLEDVQRKIMREENRYYATTNRYDNRHRDYDHDRGRRH